MARFTPEVRASARHHYEGTDKPIRQIAIDHATSERTINRWRDEDGWKRRSDQLRGLPTATRLLDAATALLAAHGKEAPRVHPLLEGEGCSSECGDASALASPLTPDPSAPRAALAAAGQPETHAQARLGAIERIERLVEKEVAIEERARAALGPLPRAPADAQRAARTLATLTQTLHALARLRGGLSPEAEPNDDDDMPRDIDEFRRALARRIEAFVESREASQP